MKDTADHFHGNQLLNIAWDRHLMFATPLCIPVPGAMPFGALTAQVLAGLFEAMPSAVAYCRMEFVAGRPEDFVYLYANPAFYRHTGLNNVTGKSVHTVIPDTRRLDPEILEIYGNVVRTGEARHRAAPRPTAGRPSGSAAS